jgi:hypothetical protein
MKFVHYLFLVLLAAVWGEELTDVDTSILKETIEGGENCMLYFYSKNCEYCKHYQQIFDIIAQGKLSDDPTMTYYSIDVDKSHELATRFLVMRVPTLYHVVSGKLYCISRHRLEMVEYFSEKRWRTMRPIWFDPFGFVGNAFGALGSTINRGMSILEQYPLKAWQWAFIFSAILGLIIAFSISLGLLLAHLFPNSTGEAEKKQD